MLSVLTNTQAQSALRILGATQTSLTAAERQISTGLRVASAKDNAAYWSIATSMSTRVGEMKAVNDGLDLTSAIISTTTAALTNILGMTQKMASLVVAAQTSGVDVATVQSQIAELQSGIISAAQSATFNGVNWLVTRVVGTNTVTQTSTTDATYAYDQGLIAHGTDGVDHEAATYAVNEDVTRTLASTSSSYDSQTNSVLFTKTGTTTAGVHTLTFATSNRSSSSSASGDPTGYRFGQIATSIGPDGSVQSSTFDFHTTELFQSFLGTSSSSDEETFTDQTINSSSPSVQQGNIAPYVTGVQDDVLDAPFLDSAGQTNILQMMLANTSDAAAAAPAIGKAITGITNAMTFLGGLQNQVDGSKQINSAIIDALTSGVGSLVDADMDQASTRLSALQTQQQLGIQSLSIANDNGQVILKLFGA